MALHVLVQKLMYRRVALYLIPSSKRKVRIWDIYFRSKCLKVKPFCTKLCHQCNILKKNGQNKSFFKKYFFAHLKCKFPLTFHWDL